jgi:hypothetical protein
MTVNFFEEVSLCDGYSVAFEFNTATGSMNVEWSPTLPPKRTRKLDDSYYLARDNFLKFVAAISGLKIAVLDPGRRATVRKRTVKGVAR